MQLGFYFNQSRCVDCYTCVVACKDWHDVPAGPACWMRLQAIEKGKFPDVSVAFLAVPCYHCTDPSCVAVCPAAAITKREDGIVAVDRTKCREEASCGIIAEQWLPKALTFGETRSPCTLTCPVHLSIPGYTALVVKGKTRQALELIRQTMPLPSVCGRVCNHPCEGECRRREVDDPVAIMSLKRFVTDHVVDDPVAPLPRTMKEKVAIIGSGPAGLAASYDLVRKGYGVTIFEALPVVGGMMAVGMPEYRLPKKALQRDVDYIKGLGVEVRTNTPLGEGLSIDDLARQGYSAFFLALGAHRGRRLPIPGADHERVLVGTSFLKDVNLGKQVELGSNVLVLGGGNVSVDCARTARRLGAARVSLACPESREKIPAYPSEIEGAEQEGIAIYPSRICTRILSQGRSITGVECLSLRWMGFDEKGALHIDVIQGSAHALPADTVIFAVGQVPELGQFASLEGLDITKQGTIAADPKTMETSRRGVFAGGDAVTGTASVIDAIAAGQRAAVYIDRYLKGEVLKQAYPDGSIRASDIRVNIEPYTERMERQKMPATPIRERVLNFSEIEMGFSEETAILEAKRCLNCAGHLCRDVCPYGAPQFGAEENPKMQKCDFCMDRLAENKKPICVASCPLRALDIGPLDELRAKYGDGREAEGFVYSSGVDPAVVFRPKV